MAIHPRASFQEMLRKNLVEKHTSEHDIREKSSQKEKGRQEERREGGREKNRKIKELNLG